MSERLDLFAFVGFCIDQVSKFTVDNPSLTAEMVNDMMVSAFVGAIQAHGHGDPNVDDLFKALEEAKEKGVVKRNGLVFSLTAISKNKHTYELFYEKPRETMN